MGVITIDGRKVEFTDEKNLLTIIRKAGIDIPTLCYHSELSTFGACRLCMVEDERGRMFASCSEEPRDGMVIRTNTERLRKYRKLIIELLLAAHCRDCLTCEKAVTVIFRHWQSVSASCMCASRTTRSRCRWISAPRRLYGIRTNASSAGTASAYAVSCRESRRSISQTAARKPWLCLRLTSRSERPTA